jgi:hypothetical protein
MGERGWCQWHVLSLEKCTYAMFGPRFGLGRRGRRCFFRFIHLWRLLLYFSLSQGRLEQVWCLLDRIGVFIIILVIFQVVKELFLFFINIVIFVAATAVARASAGRHCLVQVSVRIRIGSNHGTSMRWGAWWRHHCCVVTCCHWPKIVECVVPSRGFQRSVVRTNTRLDAAISR